MWWESVFVHLQMFCVHPMSDSASDSFALLQLCSGRQRLKAQYERGMAWKMNPSVCCSCHECSVCCRDERKRCPLMNTASFIIAPLASLAAKRRHLSRLGASVVQISIRGMFAVSTHTCRPAQTKFFIFCFYFFILYISNGP